MKKRQVSILSGAGVLCLLMGSDLFAGSQIISFPGILLRAGVIYLTLGLITYVFSPITIRTAVLGGLCAAGLVFISGATVMYTSYVLGGRASPQTTSLVLTQTQGVLVTLPISAGYLSGVLARADRRRFAIEVFLGAIVVGGYAGSVAARALGSASGFTEMAFMIGAIATGGLAVLPLVLMQSGKAVERDIPEPLEPIDWE